MRGGKIALAKNDGHCKNARPKQFCTQTKDLDFLIYIDIVDQCSSKLLLSIQYNFKYDENTIKGDLTEIRK